MDRLITPCGDNCALCPRYNACGDDELARLAELWYRVGWRDSLLPGAQMRCGGCVPGKPCAYNLWECMENTGVEHCAHCAGFPCDTLRAVLSRSDHWQRRCREVCTSEEYSALEAAFFRKAEYLGISAATDS